ncbi:MAG: hypothetical protein GTO22_16100, partial [Gemmatimonadales bacterium]|nr:hypothetical protein [Gemmatimonadales bacterium]
PGIVTASPDLPPTDGVYRSASDIHAEYQGADLHIVLQDIRHQPFVGAVVENIGADELETFDSGATATATVVMGDLVLQEVPVSLTGPVQTRVTDKAGQTTGSWDAEIVSMSLSGDVGGMQVEIRESFTQASSGRTDIADLGGGLYHIDSFFDVFTELSVDGGQTWIASTESVRVQLEQPEGANDFVAESTFTVHHLIQTPLGVIPGQVDLSAMITQIPPLNTTYQGVINTAILGPDGTVVARIVGQIDHRPIKPAIPVNTDVTFVVETVVHNAGPDGPADFYLTATAL